MINFNTVIENFNTVYENRNSTEKSYFLNASLELVTDKSQKASFFDIVDALQSRRWETEGTPSETSKAIKKLWLQTKFIYDNEPFSIRTKSKLISLFDQSITEGSFLDQQKLEVYREQVQLYCESLYLCKIIASAEENLNNLSEKIGLPANLQAYSDSLEQKYAKVLAFQKTSTFQVLRNLKYTDPIAYLGVFIEEKEGQIINTYPELLEIFELAEYAPTHSKPRGKKNKSSKQNYSSEVLRKQMFSILKKTPTEELPGNQKELLAFTYGFFKDSKMSIEEYQKYTKTNLQEYKDNILPLEKIFEKMEGLIKDYSRADELILDSIQMIKEFYQTINHEMFTQENPLPVCALHPIVKVQNIYTKSVKKFIQNFKRMYTSLRDIDPNAKASTTRIIDGDRTLNIRGTKTSFLQNRSKRFGPDFIAFIELEQDILSEHFPTLFERPNYLSNTKTRLQVKKEVESINSVYSNLIKELSKVALSQFSKQKEIHTLPDEYKSFFTLLGCDSNSLPSPEELISLNLKHPSKNFFSEQDVEALDKLITNFEDFQRKIFKQKIETYCKEYMVLKSESLKKPEVVEEESFLGTIISPENEESIHTEELTPVLKEQKIVEIKELSPSTGTIPKKKKAKKLSPSPSKQESNVFKKEELLPVGKEKKMVAIKDPFVSTGAISKNKKIKKILQSPSKQEAPVSKKSEKPVQELCSLRSLPSVRTEKKSPQFRYHKRVNRWINNPKSALQDPAYKNLTKTVDNQKETLAFHTFPKLIDSLIETNYCQENESTDNEGKRVKTYEIPGTIFLQDIQYVGHFRYAIDLEAGICFHRCFNPEIMSSAGNLDYSESQDFFHSKLSIKFYSKDQTIQIYDPAQEMEIYINPSLLTDNK